MGMSASQARLLTLTSRLHDIELQAQNIMSQKIALATQKDEIYQDYCAALDAKTIKMTLMNNGQEYKVDANYSTLCRYNTNRTSAQYALRSNITGNLFVSQKEKDMYEFYGNDKYAFAYAMLGFDNSFGWGYNTDLGAEIGIGTATDYLHNDYGADHTPDGFDLYMTDCEGNVYEAKKASDPALEAKYNEVVNGATVADRKEALEEFRDYLYDNYGTEIYEQMNLNKNDVPELAQPCDNSTWGDKKDEFEHYVRLWEAINEAGGCEVIDEQYTSGDSGTDWLNNMVDAGLVTIMISKRNDSSREWSDTSISTNISDNYLEKVADDKDLKKAEAEYEHELDLINRKDTKFDTTLSKLETERSAITTEIESIDKVKGENIERTFGIFS